MKIENGLRKLGNLFGRRGEEGSALVEFALTLPMLFGLIYLSASLTLGMYNLQQLQNATSNTAMAVGSDVSLYPNNDPCAYAASTITKSLPTWTAANFSYALVVSDNNGNQTRYPANGYTKGSSFSCALAAGTVGANYPTILTVTYSYSWLGIPAMPFFNSGTNTAGTLVASQPAIQM
ncbi:MAG TPA: TadE family protein [Terracidiphilus sp.]|jgi:Flp pilus assembly protein TadG